LKRVVRSDGRSNSWVGLHQRLQLPSGGTYQVQLRRPDDRFRIDGRGHCPVQDAQRRGAQMVAGSDPSRALFHDTSGTISAAPVYNQFPGGRGYRAARLPGGVVERGRRLRRMERIGRAPADFPKASGFEWDRPCLRTEAGGENSTILIFGASRALCLHGGWRRQIRELEVSRFGNPDRADVSAGSRVRDCCCVAMSVDILAQIGFRSSLVALASKKCNPDCGIRQGRAQDEGASGRRCGGTRRPDPVLASDPDGRLWPSSSVWWPLAIANRRPAPKMRPIPGNGRVFFGMLGVTVFGLLFTPTFYTGCAVALQENWPRAAH